MPSALEYFSYVWHFQSILAGPLVFYKDYIEFVEGYNLLSSPPGNVSLIMSPDCMVTTAEISLPIW